MGASSNPKIAFESGRILSQKMVFFGFFVPSQNHPFPRKKLVFCPKPSFSWKELVFHAKTIFPRENQENNLFGVWPHTVSKDGSFGFP